MNIFYLDNNIEKCAQAYFDCHVIKMILESAQMLSTVCIINGLSAPYRITHKNHPCTQWVSESIDNWQWLKSLSLALDEEYRNRFNHIHSHKSAEVIKTLEIPTLPSLGITERPQAMPENYKVMNNAITAYRSYYIGEKIHLMKYTRRTPPQWLSNVIKAP